MDFSLSFSLRVEQLDHKSVRISVVGIDGSEHDHHKDLHLESSLILSLDDGPWIANGMSQGVASALLRRHDPWSPDRVTP
jgi:hypothetical protein